MIMENIPHEANYLKLDCSKAKSELGWIPKWTLDKALDAIIMWTKEYEEKEDLRQICFNQIEEYENYIIGAKYE